MDSPANELLMVPMQYQPILLHSLILHFRDDAGFDPVSQALLVFHLTCLHKTLFVFAFPDHTQQNTVEDKKEGTIPSHSSANALRRSMKY